MHAGLLRHRVAIQEETAARGSTGEVTRTWATIARRWAAVQPVRARELMAANELRADVTHRVVLRYYSGLTNRHRFLFGSRILEIVEVIDPLERHEQHECLCREALT